MSKRRTNAAEAAADPAEIMQPSTDESVPAESQAAASIETPSTGDLTQQREPGNDSPEAPKRPFNPVRGWTSRFTGPVKYRKFTDANMKVIAFKFNLADNEKLPEEVLTVMRDNKVDACGQPTGLKFQVTRTHGKIWTIPNDVEGRTLADKIDFRLSELAHKMEGLQGPAPF
jgi:hypothetical protein